MSTLHDFENNFISAASSVKDGEEDFFCVLVVDGDPENSMLGVGDGKFVSLSCRVSLGTSDGTVKGVLSEPIFDCLIVGRSLGMEKGF